jgi:hypothetical protein
MSHKRTWLVAIVAALLAVVVAGVLIVLHSTTWLNTHTATPSSTTTLAPTRSQTAALPPRPHSPLADVDLPAGVVFAGNSADEERWRFSGAYDDTVAFLREQFASGRQYDAHAATWWRDLPPCYNSTHESPPSGWVQDDSTRWLWTDGSIALSVEAVRPGDADTSSEIVIDYNRWNHSDVCNRA